MQRTFRCKRALQLQGSWYVTAELESDRTARQAHLNSSSTFRQNTACGRDTPWEAMPELTKSFSRSTNMGMLEPSSRRGLTGWFPSRVSAACKNGTSGGWRSSSRHMERAYALAAFFRQAKVTPTSPPAPRLACTLVLISWACFPDGAPNKLKYLCACSSRGRLRRRAWQYTQALRVDSVTCWPTRDAAVAPWRNFPHRTNFWQASFSAR